MQVKYKRLSGVASRPRLPTSPNYSFISPCLPLSSSGLLAFLLPTPKQNVNIKGVGLLFVLFTSESMLKYLLNE